MSGHKGYSEETCVRCGWRMGAPPLNCQNDDTPHVFPSQIAGGPTASDLAATVEEWVREKVNPLSTPETRTDTAAAGRAALAALVARVDTLTRERDEGRAAHDLVQEARGRVVTIADALATLRDACDGLTSRHAALDRVEAVIARLESDTTGWQASNEALTRRAVAAEAEAARLRDGLRRIDRLAGEHDGVNEDAFEAITDITRPFLLAEDGAA